MNEEVKGKLTEHVAELDRAIGKVPAKMVLAFRDKLVALRDDLQALLVADEEQDRERPKDWRKKVVQR